MYEGGAQHAPTRRMVKPAPALTAPQRMELYDRPFRVLCVDTVGPSSPRCGEHAYIAHAECPFMRWRWVGPMAEITGEAWARFLAEEVLFDVCGFPAVL